MRPIFAQKPKQAEKLDKILSYDYNKMQIQHQMNQMQQNIQKIISKNKYIVESDTQKGEYRFKKPNPLLDLGEDQQQQPQQQHQPPRPEVGSKDKATSLG